ncbi:MAG: CDP-6-deoxy-delta-3,4-glucoseen reductase [Ectothiorhodospiraceae bacterium]|nr:CDP-6-deoxy-delta-3,4-glucoseen reductase [Ectothiorhodospiraceae bacterium]MCH8502993.1 CDP-6-deoxy-delta-3,4-glucoseen reductase [Ectothiorhodospiraceae bacterium]
MTYQITIESSGHHFTAEPGESVLQAALRHGLVIPYSCRGGSCATCMGKVVEGEVSYPDEQLPPGLDPKEAAVGQALFCLAQPRSDLSIEVREVRDSADIEPRKLPCRVVAIHRLAHDVMQLDLKLPDTERLQFLPGQCLDILMRDGRKRSYSLANPPHQDDVLQLHVRHVQGGAFSGQVFDGMKEKSLLRLEGPLGNFYLREESPRPLLLIAGGTGFAPIKSMLEHAFYVGLDRPMHFYWGVRQRRDLYLDALPAQWAREHADFHYTPCLSEPQPADEWKGRIGLVHNMVLRDFPNLEPFDVYIAGPPGMIESARRDFAAHGLPPEQLHFDSFEHAVDQPPVMTVAPGGQNG